MEINIRVTQTAQPIGPLQMLIGMFIDANNARKMKEQAEECARIAMKEYTSLIAAHKG